MRILFWCGDYYPNIGGAYVITDDLARELTRLGHQVTVLTRAIAGVPDEQVWHGYRVLRWRFPLPFEKFTPEPEFFVESTDILRRAIELLGAFDVVCIGLLDMSVYYALRLRPFFAFRLVLYLHGGDTRKLPAAEPSYRQLLETALQEADAIVPVSEDLAREAAAFLPSTAAKMRVITNGIDVESLQNALPFQHPKSYIGFVGRLVKEKDAATLIEAFQRVADRIPDLDLVLCGTGQELKRLQQLSEGPMVKRIHFLGRREREVAWAVIKGARLIVISSRTEGHPIVLLEALAAGKVVLGSAIPAIATEIEDGVNGALFSPGDSENLALLLERYCTDTHARERLANSILAMDLSRFAVRSLVQKHLQVFEQVQTVLVHLKPT